MVIDFLNHLRLEYSNRILDFESELNNLELKLNENEKIAQRFKEEEEKNYNAFSPRNQNANLKDKIHDLNLERDALSNNIDEIKKQIDDLKLKLNEIDEVIEDTNKKFSEKEKADNAFYESESSIAMRNLYIQNLTSMLHKLDFCSKLAQIDSARCKIELSSISKFIRETIDGIYTVDIKRIPADISEDSNVIH